MELTSKEIKELRKRLPEVGTFKNSSFLIPVRKPFDYTELNKTFEGAVLAPFFYIAEFKKVKSKNGFCWKYNGLNN